MLSGKNFKSFFHLWNEKQNRFILLFFIVVMAFIVLLSNVLVQFPLHGFVFGYDLSDLLTWGAFTYPFAFLVTDLVNQRYGSHASRVTVSLGFLLAVVGSIVIPPLLFSINLSESSVTLNRLFRIGIASGLAFLISQLLDISVFNRLRSSSWWRAPVYGSILGSFCDSVLFFSLAFSQVFSFLGPQDSFASESFPLLILVDCEVSRWFLWAVSDFSVKIVIAIFALIPYRMVISSWLWSKT